MRIRHAIIAFAVAALVPRANATELWGYTLNLCGGTCGNLNVPLSQRLKCMVTAFNKFLASGKSWHVIGIQEDENVQCYLPGTGTMRASECFAQGIAGHPNVAVYTKGEFAIIVNKSVLEVKSDLISKGIGTSPLRGEVAGIWVRAPNGKNLLFTTTHISTAGDHQDTAALTTNYCYRISQVVDFTDEMLKWAIPKVNVGAQPGILVTGDFNCTKNPSPNYPVVVCSNLESPVNIVTKAESDWRVCALVSSIFTDSRNFASIDLVATPTQFQEHLEAGAFASAGQIDMVEAGSPGALCSDHAMGYAQLNVAHGCVPQCGDRVCGSDGCGFSCGKCASDEECSQGHCVLVHQCNHNQKCCQSSPSGCVLCCPQNVSCAACAAD